MNLQSEHEAAVTRKKLQSLEARYESIRESPIDDSHVRELTLGSLKRMINQMKEEIIRFESRAAAMRETGREAPAPVFNVKVRTRTRPE